MELNLDKCEILILGDQKQGKSWGTEPIHSFLKVATKACKEAYNLLVCWALNVMVGKACCSCVKL